MRFEWLERVVVPGVLWWVGLAALIPGCGGSTEENRDGDEKHGDAGKGTLATAGSSGNSGGSGNPHGTTGLGVAGASSGNPGGTTALGVAGASSGGNGNVPIAGTGSSADYSTPEKACAAAVEVMCEKYFECLTPEELQFIGGLIGATVADCRSNLWSLTCAENPLSCEIGERYDATFASECIERFKAQSCVTFEESEGEVEGCEERPCVPL